MPAEDYPGYRAGYLRSAVLPVAKPSTKLSAKLAAYLKKTYGSDVLPVAKPAAKPKKTYRSAVLPAAKPAAKSAAKPKKLMKGARWIPRVTLPDYEINVEQYNPGSSWDEYYDY